MPRPSGSGYQPVHQYELPDLPEENASSSSSSSILSVSEKPLPPLPLPPLPPLPQSPSPSSSSSSHVRRWRTFIVAFLTSLLIFFGLSLATDGSLLGTSWVSRAGGGSNSKEKGKGGDECPCRQDPNTPQYFRTSPELWAGPTATAGMQPFLAQTRAFKAGGGAGGQTYIPNAPLQTDVPVDGIIGGGEDDDDEEEEGERNIFHHMGYLSPYVVSPGFGVGEWPVPKGGEIVQVQMLSRHGSRYPTTGSNVNEFGDRIAAATEHLKARGQLSFLNEWKYQLGHEILVPKGRQELFDSGVLHAYMYGNLYNPHSKIIVRTTTQDRMLKSAENFMAGFFGLEWPQNATVEVIIEEAGFNNSLAGYLNCPNAWRVGTGQAAARIWINNYLQNATARLSALVDGYDWTIEDTYAAQTTCPYETVAYGYSRFCDLFTWDEWVGFGYSIDLAFYGDDGFGSPAGRATGIGYQQEVVARLKNHTLGYSGSQINVTLDNNTVTFPLNQSIYMDFSHDSNIISILTAFGLKQFGEFLDPSSYAGKHNFTVSHLTPFGARLDMEIIKTPKPLAADRSGYLEEGGETKYVHFVLNQRTIPLGWSFPECDASRVDGWCELGKFLEVQDKMPAAAQYQRACFGDYPVQPYGFTSDGAPP
ncbi:3-phytase A [Diplogelasinospora grovesii]|uniref:3-phytase n=1 Tax=Diplogelasinospora grovesii TaxID=303347 RepID=A0AAN6MZG4_9PEZI|nr:3-phytase A [Diplogelasinospora grovesii]